MPGLAGEVANLIVALKLDDSGFSGKINAASRQLRGMDAGLAQMGRGVGQVSAGFSRLASVGLVAATAGITGVVSAAASFEDAFAGVRKTIDEAELEAAGITFEDLREEILKMSREIPISANELAKLGETAGALGIKAQDINEFIRITALLGETTDLTSDQAATSLGVLSNVLKLSGEDYDNFGAALVDLGNKGSSTETQIVQIAERIGASASLIGVSNDATLGWAASLANLGIEVEAGGSSLQKFFVESLKLIQDDDTLQILAETAGQTADAFKQAFEEDASDALESFIVGLGDLAAAEQLAVLEALGFSDIRITRALLGLAGDTDKLSATLDLASDAWRENTALTAEAEKRFDTTISKLKTLRGSVISGAIVIGDQLLPVINELAGDFADFLAKPETQRQIEEFAGGLAEGIRDVVDTLREVDWSPFITGLGIAGGVLKTAFDVFKSLPGPLQGALIGAIALNKVSGGAITLIAKGGFNILAGGLKTLFLPGRTPANPSYVWVVNQTPGVGGPGGAGRGGIPLAPVVAGAAAVAIPALTLSSSDPNTDVQARMLAKALKDGLDASEALKDTGVTLAGINEFLSRPELHTGISPAILEELDALDGELGDFAGSLDRVDGAAERLQNRMARFARERLFDAPVPGTDDRRLRKSGLSVSSGVPDTAALESVDVTSLPDTAMSALTGTESAVSQLPEIIRQSVGVSRSSDAMLLASSAMLAQKVGEQRQELGTGFQSVRSAIDRQDTSVDVTVPVTVNAFVNNQMVNRVSTVTRIAQDRRGGFIEGSVS